MLKHSKGQGFSSSGLGSFKEKKGSVGDLPFPAASLHQRKRHLQQVSCRAAARVFFTRAQEGFRSTVARALAAEGSSAARESEAAREKETVAEVRHWGDLQPPAEVRARVRQGTAIGDAKEVQGSQACQGGELLECQAC
ncbi:uncharacterized protein LOC131163391 [Malania oleifera]|uniref:uncharacterized protein LOC131163391 n=1 Tax=Malania oleifera TaxID=397392 RepID=UPI0025AE21C7|nr:uncharacterized protein LOC131163391 [Malania oleifera]